MQEVSIFATRLADLRLSRSLLQLVGGTIQRHDAAPHYLRTEPWTTLRQTVIVANQ